MDLKASASRTNPWLFIISCLLVLVMMGLGVQDSRMFSSLIAEINTFIYTYFGDFYLWFLLLSLLGLVGLGLSPLGRIRLGGPDARPKHSYFSWFSMLFNAGMGTGIMFWGAAEPLYHFTHPPDVTALAGPQEAAFAYTFLHWGFGPWALYALTAIAIGFFGFNLQKGFRFSSFLVREESRPAGPEVRGKRPLTFIIDLVTILAVVFGVASSIGMGTLSLEGGLQMLTGIGSSPWMELALIATMTVIFLVSACNGLERGIKFLSNLCLWLTLVLMAALMVLGPTVQMVGALFSGLWVYLANLPQLSLGLQGDPTWVGDWTVKYWSWWIAWAPFVGIFIALISKGRTIRQIIWTVMVAPTLFSCLWFSVLGMAALDYQITHGFSQALLEFEQVHQILFRTLEVYTSTPVLSWLSMVAIVIFIANSADSAAYTIACLSNRETCSRKAMEKPGNLHIIGWGLLFALLAAVLLLSGGIRMLEDVTTITVLPFALLLLLVFINLFKDLRRYDALEKKHQTLLAQDAALSLEQVAAEASPGA